jgi:CspA family cold shock protein
MSTNEAATVTVTVAAAAAATNRIIGKVKWFNNKAGYGFITVCDGEHSGKDIFVHFSSIRIENTQYRFLTQGEYVEFALVKSDNEKHEYLAVDITGIKGGPIMCETRRVNMSAKPLSETRKYTERPPSPTDAPSNPSVGEEGGFTRVHSKPRAKKPSKRTA